MLIQKRYASNGTKTNLFNLLASFSSASASSLYSSALGCVYVCFWKNDGKKKNRKLKCKSEHLVNTLENIYIVSHFIKSNLASAEVSCIHFETCRFLVDFIHSFIQVLYHRQHKHKLVFLLVPSSYCANAIEK